MLESWGAYYAGVDVEPEVQPALIANAAEDGPTYREAIASAEAAQWKDAIRTEYQNLQDHAIFTEVREDTLPTWRARDREAREVVKILWVLKRKLNERREVEKYKARAVFDGSEQKRKAASAGVELITSAPTCRQATHKVHCAVVATRRRVMLSFDVKAAYLNGKATGAAKCYSRPPPGYRLSVCNLCDTRYPGDGSQCPNPECGGRTTGVGSTTPIVWDLHGNLYGKCDAGHIWNEALVARLAVAQGFRRSMHDPCLFSKRLRSGEYMYITTYVDDGMTSWDAADDAEARQELATFDKVYAITIKEPTRYYLGGNIDATHPGRVQLSSTTYVQGLVEYLPRPLDSYPAYAVPAAPDLVELYEAARDSEGPADAALLASYPKKVGALLYVGPQARPDVSYAIGVLARVMSRPTAEMDAAADRVIAYLAQHPDWGPTYDESTERAAEMHAYSDSDWAVSHSTTGWVIMYGGAAVAYGSRRQHSIALSSTEAEIMAASVAASEVVHIRGLLRDFGVACNTPTRLHVDNSGAVELARSGRTCGRSRHIHRRYLKVQEWVQEGEVEVVKVATADNLADPFTKPLQREPFARLMAGVMGTGVT